MAVDNIKKNGQANAYKSNAGGASLISEPVVGIVKNNIDPTHTGMIDVYVARLGGTDPDDSTNWIKGVKYLSPFYGITGSGTNPLTDGEKTGDGKFVGNPQSYGFWASAPDIGTEVVCIFVNGLANQGYYIGCVPKPGLLQMTPALGSSSNVVPNESEGQSYGGADRLPTSEVNYSNPATRKSPQIYNEPKPVHSYQAAILAAQGLVRDPVRGTISSSAQRETPSRVFGFSTPGGPIFEGGFTNQTIKDAVKTATPEKLKQVGRTGGHSFVMDDGTLTGQDQLIRLRSSAGHQITMSDTGQTLFIIHSNGQSWIEMGKEGTIDIYSTNSFNVRTQGDINFHADRDINLNAAKNLNMYGENINIESSKNYSQRVGVDYAQYTMGKYTVKVDGAMSQQSSGQASYASSSETFINGSKVNLNSGSASTAPQIVPVIPPIKHTDTVFSQKVGWAESTDDKITSIVNRAPTHQPWVGSGKGVDVKVESTAPSSTSQTSPATAVANAATPATPTVPTTAAAVAAAPVTPSNNTVTQAVTAQIATSAQAAPTVNTLGVATGVTTAIASTAGVSKPGSTALVDDRMAKGMPAAKALGSVMTGADGATTSEQFLQSVAQQNKAVVATVNKAAVQLTANGTITGKESPVQVAGIITGAAINGVGAVTAFVKTGATTVAGLANNIAGGKFAAGLVSGQNAGGLMTSLAGLATGVKGTLGSFGDTIGDIAAGIKAGAQSSFSLIEASFGTLKAGVANVLGPKSNGPAATQQPSDVAKAGDAYVIAEAEIESATDALFTAKRNYRNEQTPENSAALQTAEANLSAAKQRQAQASTAFLKSAVGGAVSTPLTANTALGTAVGAATSAVKNTLNSGLNALPGGPAVLQSVVNNGPVGAALGTASTALNVVNSSLGTIGGLAASADKLKGDLVGGTKGLVDDAMSTASGLAANAVGDFKAGAAGMMAQLQSTLGSVSSGIGGVRQAAAAVNTFDNSAIIAKTGQLLGDPKIPSPSSVFAGSPLPPGDATQASAEVTAALDAVKDAGYKVQAAKLNLTMASKTGDASLIAQATEGLKTEEEALKVAQDAYTSLVSA